MANGLVLRSMNVRESRRTSLDLFRGELLELLKTDATDRPVLPGELALWRLGCGLAYPFLPQNVLK